MKLNMGLADRFVRILAAILIWLSYYTSNISLFWGYILVVIAYILFATAIFGVCPLYTLLGIDTRSRHKTHTRRSKIG